MTTDETVQAFMREGLSKYPVARSTVKYFEDQLCQIARGALEAQARLNKFSVEGVPHWISGEGLHGTSGSVVATLKPGSGQKTQIEVGLWWNPPELKLADPPVIAFASIYKNPEDLFSFQPNFIDVRAHSFDYTFKGRKFTIVYTPLAEIPDPREAIEFVIRWLYVQIDQYWKSHQKADSLPAEG